MNKIRIALMADSRWRDTIGIALVRKELIARGYDARVISFHICQQAIPAFKPHALVLNHLFGKRNQELARFTKRHGGIVLIMPTEGRPNTDKQLEWSSQQSRHSDLYDRYLAWSNVVANTIEKSVVTGCPRFDVYRPEFAHLIESKDIIQAKYGIDGSKKVVGITTSFPSAKFMYVNRKFHIQDWNDLDIDADPVAAAEHEYRQMEQFKNWIQFVVQLLKDDFQFILKPHPMGDRLMWQSFCEENGIILAPLDYIHNFLRACDVLVSRAGCSTAQDAWLMSPALPSIQLWLPPNGDFDGPAREAAELSLYTARPEDLFASLVYRLSSHYIPDKSEYLEKYGFLQDYPAHENVCNEIDSAIKDRDFSTISPLTLDDEIMLNKLNMQLMQNTIYPNPLEIHAQKHVPEQVVWAKEIEI